MNCFQFGVHGSGMKDEFAQSYRRITSSGLFTKMDKKLAPLKNLDPISPKNKKYVLVEEERLQELLQFDAVLQQERRLLGVQCSNLFLDQHMPAWVPLPATRHAIHHLCEQQMHRARSEIVRLQTAWEDYCVKNHYNSPPIYMKRSFVETAPLAQRALKLRLVREARHVWNQRRERDTMLFEDELSRWSNIYTDAMIRQRDYERYFILATRYGAFSEEEFNSDPRPGKRYYTKVVRGALKLQLLWDRYWAMARLRRYRAARNIQKQIRRFLIYRKLHPIIRLRLKFGKRTYYMYCMALWKRYIYLVKMIRESIVFYRSNYVGICFGSWKKFAMENKAARNAKIRKMMLRAQNSEVYRTFSRWVKYTNQNKSLKRKLRRWFGLPQFDMWLEYVRWQKHLKTLHKAATRCQNRIRIFLSRHKVVKRKEAVNNLHHFMRVVRAVQQVRKKKMEAIANEYVLWLPEETLRRAQRLNEQERGRLQRKQAHIQAKEKVATKELQDHLSSRDGNRQLEQLWIASPDLISQLRLEGLSRGERKKKVYDHLSNQLRRQYLDYVQCLEGHNFDVKFPPFVKCFDYHCGATFTSEAQYHHHCSLPASSHPPTGLSAHPQATAFHMMLRHPKGQDILRTHWTLLYGVSGLVGMLDLYLALQDLKKTPSQSTSFYTKALLVFDLFCSPNGARRLNLQDFEGRAALDDTFARLHEHNITAFPGFYHDTRARPGLIRKYVLGWEGVQYVHFSPDLILRPDTFQALELHVFLVMLKAIVEDNAGELLKHPSYVAVLAEETVAKDQDMRRDYEQYRRSLIRAWTRGYMQHAAMISAKATEVVDQIMEDEVMRLYGVLEKRAVKEAVIRRHYHEQLVHEERMLLIDDAVAWVEESALEFIFDFYSRALVEAMWEVTDYRKGMLQYAGLLKTNLKKKIGVDDIPSVAKKADKEWFDQFLARTFALERILQPLSTDQAATRIQNRIRIILARKRARIAFAKRYKKFYDESYQSYYYFDNVTGESMWQPPILFRIFYPNAQW